MIKKGLVQEQIALAERAKPQGFISASFAEHLQQVVEREDLIRWANGTL